MLLKEQEMPVNEGSQPLSEKSSRNLADFE
jgi:hypothetical protein